MMDKYNNRYILDKIADYKFNLHDVVPRKFPQLIADSPTYCDFHPNSHKGKANATLKYDENTGIWALHCWVCGRNYYVHDYINIILVRELGRYRSIKEYLLKHMKEEEFQALYNMFYEQRDVEIHTMFDKKREHIENTYDENPNTIDFIEKLYTC